MVPRKRVLMIFYKALTLSLLQNTQTFKKKVKHKLLDNISW